MIQEHALVGDVAEKGGRMSEKRKAIGVMGGMGPYATLAFFKSILDNTPAQKDWDHARVIIDNNPQIPSRTRAFLFGEEDPVPQMIASANSLKAAGADFVLMPCNSAHYFLPRIREQTNIPFVDMIGLVSEVVLSMGVRQVGLLAGEVTVKGGLYEQRLEKHGVHVLQVSDDEQAVVRSVIEDAKKNAITNGTRSKLRELIGRLAERGAKAVILGCTELPIVLQGEDAGCVLIDSMDVLAKEAVRLAGG